MGGSRPPFHCLSDKFSLPGSNSSLGCFSATYILITVNIPFSVIQSDSFVHVVVEERVVELLNISPKFVFVSAIAQIDDLLAQIVVKAAFSDSGTAFRTLNSANTKLLSLCRYLANESVTSCSLSSIAITACPGGYELVEGKCLICPALSFCEGGISVRQGCPPETVSNEGSSSSKQCNSSLFVLITFSIPVLPSNFPNINLLLLRALSSTTGTPASQIFLVNYTISGSRRSATSMQTFQAYVVVENPEQAITIQTKVSDSTFNSALMSEGLPAATVQSVQGISSQTQNNNFSVVTWASISASGFFFIGLGLSSYLIRLFLRQAAHRKFIAAHRSCKLGNKISDDFLPWSMRKTYSCQVLLGKGAQGSIVLAKRKKDGRLEVLKIQIPRKEIFNAQELRHLQREAFVLNMVTVEKCENAVNLSGIEAIQILPTHSVIVMDYLQGENLECEIKQSPISDIECIKMARSVLIALKSLHSVGLVHRDIKPANIMHTTPLNRTGSRLETEAFDKSPCYKLIDFGSIIGVDEKLAQEKMMTVVNGGNEFAGTYAYMSPEMFIRPETSMYATDIWSLGVTMFEAVTGKLPFNAESDHLWPIAIAGNMNDTAPEIFDALPDDRCPYFDRNLASVIAKALEKNIQSRYSCVDEMNEALYNCLVCKGEAFYSVFISYRVASEEPLARLLFEELNHSLTPGGHRVTVYWDAHRLIKGEDWGDGFSTGLLNSLCFFPILSYGSTAPLAALPDDGPELSAMIAKGWDELPIGRKRLKGLDSDVEDNVLKELMIAAAILGRNSDCNKLGPEQGLLQVAYPILVGRQFPLGHSHYPGMGNFFEISGGGGKYANSSSPATSRSVAEFLKSKANLPAHIIEDAENKSIAGTVESFMKLQGCQLQNQSPGLEGVDLTIEQKNLIGKGYAGPHLDHNVGPMSMGFDEMQLRMLKSQIQEKRKDFHEIIDRAFNAAIPRLRASATIGHSFKVKESFQMMENRANKAEDIDYQLQVGVGKEIEVMGNLVVSQQPSALCDSEQSRQNVAASLTFIKNG